MIVYVITREGIYRHEVLGIFTTEQAAIDRAAQIDAGEPDHWHDIDIWTATLDVPIEDVTLLHKINTRQDRTRPDRVQFYFPVPKL